MTSDDAAQPDVELEPVTITHECRPAERSEAATVLAIAARSNLTPTAGGFVEVAAASKFNRGAFGWALFLAMGFLLVLLMSQTPPPTPAPGVASPIGARARARATIVHAAAWPTDVKVMASVVAVGVLCLAGSVAVGAASTRRQRQRWDGRLRFTFTTDALVVSRPGRTEVRHWSRLPGYLETRDLLIVRIDRRRGFILPKRLFGSDQEAARARQMLERAYGTPQQRQPRTMGFPVTMPSRPGCLTPHA